MPLDRLQVFGDIRLGTTGTNGCLKNFAGTGLAGTCSSDERLKTNIVEFQDGYLEKLLELKIISYNWNDTAKEVNKVDTAATNYALLAQNVESVFPEFVSIDSNGYKQVDYSRLPLYMLKSVQELGSRVAGLAEEFRTKKLRTQELCVDDVCVTKDQFRRMLENTGSGYSINPIVNTVVQPVIEIPVSNDLNDSTETPIVDDSTLTTEELLVVENPAPTASIETTSEEVTLSAEPVSQIEITQQ